MVGVGAAVQFVQRFLFKRSQHLSFDALASVGGPGNSAGSRAGVFCFLQGSESLYRSMVAPGFDPVQEGNL